MLPTVTRSDTRSPWPLYLIFFASGCAGLVYEVMWTRSLGLVFGSTTRAASVFGRRLGFVYALNTLGGIAGELLAASGCHARSVCGSMFAPGSLPRIAPYEFEPLGRVHRPVVGELAQPRAVDPPNFGLRARRRLRHRVFE